MSSQLAHTDTVTSVAKHPFEFLCEQRVLVLAPHPDDECLSSGILIARAIAHGAHVHVAFLTDGDNAPWIQRVYERRVRIGEIDRKRFGSLRREEALASLRELGLGAQGASFLGVPDQGLTPALLCGGEPLVSRLVALFEAERPEILVLPAPWDLHPDHSALAVLAAAALDRVRDRISPRVLHCAVHQRAGLPWHESAARITPSADEREKKRNAIRRHASQMSVHAKKFLGRAEGDEIFFEEGEAQVVPVDHPLTASSITGTTLRLTVTPRAHIGAHGAASIFLCALGDELQLRSFALPRGGGSSPLLDLSTGRPAGTVHIDAVEGRFDVTLDLAQVLGGDARRLFVKIERRFGFFDEGGYVEIALPGSCIEAPMRRSLTTTRPPYVCAIVPCFNIAALCGPVVREAAHLVDRVIAIDDGSSDETRAVLEQVARYHPGRVRVLAFDVNRGKGAALLAAFRLAVSELPFDYLVTLDGDGQHCPRDIPRLLHGFEHGGEFVIGSRAGAARIPWRSRFGNALTTKILNLIARDCPRDTQSGFRGLSRQFVVEVLREVGGARYELELRILLLALHQRRRIAEVPIPTIYLDENRSSHFRPLEDSLRIYAALFRHGLPLMVGARARRKSS